MGFGLGLLAATFFFQSSKLSFDNRFRINSVTSFSLTPNSTFNTSKGLVFLGFFSKVLIEWIVFEKKS
jgi:hypothetical protein